jgi:alkaline phosphatase
VKSILELARDSGMKTGFVVTSSVVHATPASFYAHVSSRGSYEEIAKQLVYSDIDVFVGGGEKYFSNRRSDPVDLLKILKDKEYRVISSHDPHGKFNLEKIHAQEKIACFTAYEDPTRASMGRGYLPWMVIKAVEALKKRAEQGYFMLVEASQIDWAAHSNDQNWLAFEMQDAYDMMELLLQKVKEDEDTLLIITADHECGYISLEGKRSPRIVFNSKVHSSQMVPVFALGPGAEEFLGIYENTEIFVKMKKLLGL